jgi:hypothetical protein
MVSSKGTLVNKLDTSNEMRVSFDVAVHLFSSLIKDRVLSTVYSDVARGAKSFSKYLDVLYVAVPMFDTIGRIGNIDGPPFSGTLCTFAVL